MFRAGCALAGLLVVLSSCQRNSSVNQAATENVATAASLAEAPKGLSLAKLPSKIISGRIIVTRRNTDSQGKLLALNTTNVMDEARARIGKHLPKGMTVVAKPFLAAPRRALKRANALRAQAASRHVVIEIP